MTKQKILAGLLGGCLVLAAALPTAVAGKAAPFVKPSHLSFRPDGSFWILQVADLQDNDRIGEKPLSLLRLAIEKTDPDLIVMTGDNLMGPDCPTTEQATAAIRAYMDLFASYGVPVAAVFGNHDDDRTALTKEAQMELYMSYDCFVGGKGIIASKTVGENTMENVGTYNLPVYAAADSDTVAYNIWCFDSGVNNPDQNYGGYGYVLPEQIDWYVETSNALKEANGGVVVPSVVFQHIIPPQVYRSLKEVPEGTAGAVKRDDRYYVLPDGIDSATNWMHQAPLSPALDCPDAYAALDAMLAQGDVRAVFCGHDHTNCYVVPYGGIDLAASPSCIKGAYNDATRGFRVITLRADDPDGYETQIVSEEILRKAPSFRERVGAFFDGVADAISAFFLRIWLGLVTLFGGIC